MNQFRQWKIDNCIKETRIYHKNKKETCIVIFIGGQVV